MFRQNAASKHFACSLIKVPALCRDFFLGFQEMKRPQLALLASLLLTAGIYWPGLAGPLVFDDAQNLAPLNDWLQGRVSWLAVVLGNHSGLFGRPVSMASFVLNVELLGPGVWGFKLGNLLIHLANGTLVFALLARLMGLGALAQGTRRDLNWLPWLGASLWLLHPLLASTVLYVVQRMTMLSTLFTLLTLLAYLHGRANLGSRPRSALASLLLLAPFFTLLAVLSKENGALAPSLCAMLELLVFPPEPGKRRAWLSRAFIATALVLPTLIALGLIVTQAPFVVAGYQNRPFTLSERLLTESRVLWDYVGAMLVPGGPRLGLYHDDYILSRGLLSPPDTLLSIAAWLATIAFAWRLRRHIPGLALGLGIFLIGQSMESSIFPLLIYFEHRNYLPLLGILWALLSLAAFAAPMLAARMPRVAVVSKAAVGVLLVVLALGTHLRASAWSSRDSLLRQSLLHHPDSRWLRTDLILNAMQQNPPRLAEASRHADHLLAMEDPLAQQFGAIERVMIECASGRQPDPGVVEAMFDGSGNPIEPDLLLAFDNLSDGIVRQPCAGLSPRQMANGLARMLDQSNLAPGTLGVWRLRYRAANLYVAAEQPDNAIRQAELSISGGTAQTQVNLFLAALLIEKGDVQAARAALEAAAAALKRGETRGKELLGLYRKQLDSLEIQARQD